MKVKPSITEYSSRFIQRFPEKQVLIALSFFIGAVAAIVVYLFEAAVINIKNFVFGLYSSEGANYLLFVTPVMGIIIVTLFVKYFVKDDISHGVTKVLKAISQKSSKIKSHNTYSSMIAGAITIGFGGSVGPEAPTVLTGSAIGSNFGKFFGLNHRQTTILLGCGAAAALAAIFKAPITGVVFVLEVLLIEMAISSIIPLLIAAVTATMITYVLHGSEPVFSTILPPVPVTMIDIPFYLILGVVCGLVSYYIIYSSG
ncbi:MAG: chloride channel protein, partial [Rikenellaceae bacterium]